MELSKKDLLRILFDENIVTANNSGKTFRVDFTSLALHPVVRMFADDLIDTYKKLRAQHDKELELIVYLPFSMNLGSIMVQELGIKAATYHKKAGVLASHKPNSDYVYLAHCIAEGRGLEATHLKLQQHNSHIVFGLCMFDKELCSNKIKNLNIDIYSTLKWADFGEYYGSSLGAPRPL